MLNAVRNSIAVGNTSTLRMRAPGESAAAAKVEAAARAAPPPATAWANARLLVFMMNSNLAAAEKICGRGRYRGSCPLELYRLIPEEMRRGAGGLRKERRLSLCPETFPCEETLLRSRLGLDVDDFHAAGADIDAPHVPGGPIGGMVSPFSATLTPPALPTKSCTDSSALNRVHETGFEIVFEHSLAVNNYAHPGAIGEPQLELNRLGAARLERAPRREPACSRPRSGVAPAPAFAGTWFAGGSDAPARGRRRMAQIVGAAARQAALPGPRWPGRKRARRQAAPPSRRRPASVIRWRRTKSVKISANFARHRRSRAAFGVPFAQRRIRPGWSPA